MTKAELIETIAKKAGLSKAAAEKALNSTTEAIAKCLKKNDKITLTGFGTFSISKRKARSGRNPQTGEKIKIKAAKVAKFKPSEALKKTIK